ncbi:uncharacterized protein THITE_2116327 [Thermothielavioides terrestris NRRL 8126]|uniref:Rhodopsin domain-containing protein n=1 Tax=Thermothielavioides terrestris (strain ATCC 38088 / NRRL 8126) TaxID=578455 RepID=G2R5F8_THETT|nr:uncharacterized protein THITE_2116327 [Thermothielavioides terrestris NRRL 8126]AEO67449.1 hypothetical protein THITE_2116327 [Thermothielavioides terrestris NRRL 8126]
MTDFWKASYFDTLSYNFSLCCTKISILLLYLRVLTPDYIRKVIWVAFGIVVLYNAWAFAMELTICIPLAKEWDPSLPGYCHPTSVWWALTYIHIATDFMLFVIPIPVVVTMTIPTRRKAGLLFVFTLGLFVCLISVVRTIILSRLLDSADPMWDYVVIANWTSAETNAAIICACMPTLRPVLAALLKRLFPHFDQSLEDPSSNRPRTIGSMPIQAPRFGRGSSNNQRTLPPLSDSSWALAHGGTASVTTVETRQSTGRRQDGVSKVVSTADGEPSDVELESGLAPTPTVPAKPRNSR